MFQQMARYGLLSSARTDGKVQELEMTSIQSNKSSVNTQHDIKKVLQAFSSRSEDDWLSYLENGGVEDEEFKAGWKYLLIHCGPCPYTNSFFYMKPPGSSKEWEPISSVLRSSQLLEKLMDTHRSIFVELKGLLARIEEEEAVTGSSSIKPSGYCHPWNGYMDKAFKEIFLPGITKQRNNLDTVIPRFVEARKTLEIGKMYTITPKVLIQTEFDAINDSVHEDCGSPHGCWCARLSERSRKLGLDSDCRTGRSALIGNRWDISSTDICEMQKEKKSSLRVLFGILESSRKLTEAKLARSRRGLDGPPLASLKELYGVSLQAIQSPIGLRVFTGEMLDGIKAWANRLREAPEISLLGYWLVIGHVFDFEDDVKRLSLYVIGNFVLDDKGNFCLRHYERVKDWVDLPEIVPPSMLGVLKNKLALTTLTLESSSARIEKELQLVWMAAEKCCRERLEKILDPGLPLSKIWVDVLPQMGVASRKLYQTGTDRIELPVGQILHRLIGLKDVVVSDAWTGRKVNGPVIEHEEGCIVEQEVLETIEHELSIAFCTTEDREARHAGSPFNFEAPNAGTDLYSTVILWFKKSLQLRSADFPTLEELHSELRNQAPRREMWPIFRAPQAIVDAALYYSNFSKK
ncbi:hypothetical protein BJ508DRAFT_311305 [Ascobolus immersus RN42]|uniref:Uncharacterized protein n=1 Tax=Ascobolus immersus RN42 TaxID=1160509 RepID=A0A3N4HR65_ASCIM|nr:hypothetical protein BJ508DRAFT_311305 [Ascobolus immersus RN42]